ncbi:MAG: hypothetical protein WD969_14120 [Paracoccaceae bacterium]
MNATTRVDKLDGAAALILRVGLVWLIFLRAASIRGSRGVTMASI